MICGTSAAPVSARPEKVGVAVVTVLPFPGFVSVTAGAPAAFTVSDPTAGAVLPPASPMWMTTVAFCGVV